MPSQTILVRSHARTIYTRPVTFICAQCHTPTTRECYPGKTPQYCLHCRPRRKKSPHTRPEKGMFKPTHYLVASDGRKTEVCLEKTTNAGWYGVRTALDWFSGSSIIQYHPEKGIVSNDTPLSGYILTPLPEDKKSQAQPSTSKTKSKAKKQKKTASAQAATLENRAYSGRQLMKRLRCGDRLLRIKRERPDFSEWSRKRDPDGIAWQYQDGQFVHLEGSNLNSSSDNLQPQPLPSSSPTKSQTKQQKKTVKKKKKTTSAQAATLKNQAYSGRQLMKRLRCGDRLLRIKRERPDFSEWSRKRDPDGIAWQYQDGHFLPQLG